MAAMDTQEEPRAQLTPPLLDDGEFEDRYIHGPKRVKDTFFARVNEYKLVQAQLAYHEALKRRAVQSRAASKPFVWSPATHPPVLKSERSLPDARHFPSAGGGFSGANVVPRSRTPNPAEKRRGVVDEELGTVLDFGDSYLGTPAADNDTPMPGAEQEMPQLPPATAPPRHAWGNAQPRVRGGEAAETRPPLEACKSAPSLGVQNPGITSQSAAMLLADGMPLGAMLAPEDSFGLPRNDTAWLRVGTGRLTPPAPPIPMARAPFEGRLEPLAPRRQPPGPDGIFGPPDAADARRMAVNGSHVVSKREQDALTARKARLARWQGATAQKKARLAAARALNDFLVREGPTEPPPQANAKAIAMDGL